MFKCKAVPDTIHFTPKRNHHLNSKQLCPLQLLLFSSPGFKALVRAVAASLPGAPACRRPHTAKPDPGRALCVRSKDARAARERPLVSREQPARVRDPPAPPGHPRRVQTRPEQDPALPSQQIQIIHQPLGNLSSRSQKCKL